ncbi:armadillo-type protein [Mycena galopus ATCC 62051]|nr:armadillo-type protein [Mycena galopus ATCC 62051]
MAKFEDGAQAIVNAGVLNHILELLKSPDPYIRRRTCVLLRELAGHESTAPAISKLKTCEKLVSLWSDKHSGVIWEATAALSRIAQWPDEAKVIVEAKAAHHVLALLESPGPHTRIWACKLIGRLAGHESTAPAILELKPCARLVPLLHDDCYDSQIIEWAIYALCQIARWVDGAWAIVNANGTGRILILLESPRSQVRAWTCVLMGTLARHDSTAPAILQRELARHLVCLLRDPVDVETRDGAISALEAISEWPLGVADLADMDGDMLERLEELTHNQSLDLERQVQICKILDNIAGTF